MKSAIGKEFFEQMENIIKIPQLCSPYGTQYYYTLEDADNIIMYSTLSQQYFRLERVRADILSKRGTNFMENILHRDISEMGYVTPTI